MFGFNRKPPPLPPPPVLNGDQFRYMGVELLCLGTYRLMGVPHIACEYRDSNGVLRGRDFAPREWHALAREIQRNGGGK
jgi:hypothetical protein